MKIVLAAGKSIILLILTAVLLRFAVLGLSKFDYRQSREADGSAAAAQSKLTDWDAIFSGRVFYSGVLDLATHFKNLGMTGIMVFLGLIISTGFSLLLGYHQARRPHSAWWDGLAGMGTLVSGIPLFIVGLVASLLLPQANSPWVTLLTLFAGGVILGSFEGALSENPRNFRLIFGELQDRTYYLACRARGQSTLGIHYRAIRPFLIRSLGTRISYLFGGAIVVEWALDINYLGFRFADSIIYAGSQRDYCDAMISGLLLIAVPLLIRMILSVMPQSGPVGFSVAEPVPGS